jgi:MFS superfamily sulfate permease-like transporter
MVSVTVGCTCGISVISIISAGVTSIAGVPGAIVGSKAGARSSISLSITDPDTSFAPEVISCSLTTLMFWDWFSAGVVPVSCTLISNRLLA